MAVHVFTANTQASAINSDPSYVYHSDVVDTHIRTSGVGDRSGLDYVLVGNNHQNKALFRFNGLLAAIGSANVISATLHLSYVTWGTNGQTGNGLDHYFYRVLKPWTADADLTNYNAASTLAWESSMANGATDRTDGEVIVAVGSAVEAFDVTTLIQAIATAGVDNGLLLSRAFAGSEAKISAAEATNGLRPELIVVTDQNTTPTIEPIADVEYGVGDTITNITVTAADTDAGDVLTVTATPLPSGVSFSDPTISGTVDTEETKLVTVTAQDDSGDGASDTATEQFIFTVVGAGKQVVTSTVDYADLNSASPFIDLITDSDLEVGDQFDLPLVAESRNVTIGSDGLVSADGEGTIVIPNVYIRDASNSYTRVGPITITLIRINITQHPQPQEVNESGSFTFTVVAEDADTYQWRKNGVDISGATSSSYTGTEGTDGVNGDYFTVVMTNAATSAVIESNAAYLVMAAADFVTAPTQFTLNDIADAEPGSAQSRSFTLAGITENYPVQLDATGAGTVDVNGGTPAASVSVQRDDVITVHATASASFDGVVTAGAICEGVSDSFTITTRSAVAPTFSTNPATQSVVEDDIVTLTVVANDAISLQWYKNAVAISGETSASYNFTVALSNDGDEYYVVAAGEGSTSAQSSTATITVTSLDVTAPAFSSGPSVTPAATTAAITATLNENCTVAALVTSAGAEEPLEAAFNGSSVTSSATSGVSVGLSVTGLTAEMAYTAWLEATDSSGNRSVAPANFTTTAPNSAPVVSPPAPLSLEFPSGGSGLSKSNPALQAWIAQGTATDFEDGSLTALGDLSALSDPIQAGVYSTIPFVSAADSLGLTGTAFGILTVTEAQAANPEPVSLGNYAQQAATVGVPFTFAGGTNIVDTDILAYSISGHPPGLTINSGTGEVSGTPTTSGGYTATITATDTAGQTISVLLPIVVSAAASTVVLFPTNRTVKWDQASTPNLVIGDDFWHQATLCQGSESTAFNVALADTIKVAIVDSKHTAALSDAVTMSAVTSGSDWSAGIVSILIPAAITAQLSGLISEPVLAKIEIEVVLADKRYTWFGTVRLTQGYIN